MYFVGKWISTLFFKIDFPLIYHTFVLFLEYSATLCTLFFCVCVLSVRLRRIQVWYSGCTEREERMNQNRKLKKQKNTQNFLQKRQSHDRLESRKALADLRGRREEGRYIQIESPNIHFIIYCTFCFHDLKCIHPNGRCPDGGLADVFVNLKTDFFFLHEMSRLSSSDWNIVAFGCGKELALDQSTFQLGD